MPIFDQGYQHWSGSLSGHAWRWWTIARQGVRVGMKNPFLRILVIVSDGVHDQDDVAAARQRITRLTAVGCGVLWLGPETTASWPSQIARVVTLTDPAATITTIAQAAARTLTT